MLQVFLLIDESTVRRYKADLRDEIEPQIIELISRAEKGLKTLQKKEAVLQTKVEVAQSQPASRPTAGVAASNKVEGRRLQMLVRQREQLEQELRELENEVLSLVGGLTLLLLLNMLNGAFFYLVQEAKQKR